VITVCDAANEACPVFPGQASRIHWSFDDPSRGTGSGAERLPTSGRVRDDIVRTIADWLAGGGLMAA
jgi:arsenate reductase